MKSGQSKTQNINNVAMRRRLNQGANHQHRRQQQQAKMLHAHNNITFDSERIGDKGNNNLDFDRNVQLQNITIDTEKKM